MARPKQLIIPTAINKGERLKDEIILKHPSMLFNLDNQEEQAVNLVKYLHANTTAFFFEKLREQLEYYKR